MSAGALPSDLDSTCNEKVSRQPNISEWADRTPSSQERPECLSIHASKGLQASERPAGSHVAKRNAENKPQHREGPPHVSHAPFKGKGKAERRGLSVLPPNSHSGAAVAVNQHQVPALSSFGIAQQNAAKFTDGEVRHTCHQSDPGLLQDLPCCAMLLPSDCYGKDLRWIV